ncbi:hypothetical protein HYDPIDRAFT_101174, partial [Hydnomerulius pinastri MD-312]
MSDIESPQGVYARLLLRAEPSRGYPLWVPEPDSNLPTEYQSKGLRVGDVGVVTEDGSFDVFFNICLPETHPLHGAYGVPAGFRQIVLHDRDISRFPFIDGPGKVVSTQSISQRRLVAGMSASSNTAVLSNAGLNYAFTFSSADGALLVLPEGADSYKLLNESTFRDAALQNGESWYDFAYSTLGRTMISNDSLYLVTGCHKAKSWSLA